MPGNLSSALRAEMARPGGIIHKTLTMHFASGDMRISHVPVNSDTQGTFRQRVLSWSPIKRAASGLEHGLRLVTAGAKISDQDVRFGRLLRDENRYSVSGTRCVIEVGSPLVDPGDWAIFFDGVLDTRDQESPYVWNLGFSSNDKPLLGQIPKLALLPAHWPNPADKTIYQQWAPSYYGVHDSRGTTDAGMVRCPLVDRLFNSGNGRYLVSFAWMKDVPRVYRSSLGLATSSTYAISHPLVGGYRWTCIEPTSSWGDDEVLCDVEGYETVGDGSGTLIQGVDQVKHALVNFAYNEVPDGLWLTDADAPVHTAGFAAAEAFLERQGWEHSSIAFGGQQHTKAKDLISSFLKSKQALAVFFRRDGLISLGPSDHALLPVAYNEPQWIRYDKHAVGKAGGLKGPDSLRDHMADRISARYLPDAGASVLRRTLEVRDIRRDPTDPSVFIPDAAPDSIDLPFSHASLEVE